MLRVSMVIKIQCLLFIYSNVIGDQGPKWRRGFAKIHLEYFQVIFEAMSSQGKRDNIALDDIRIAECTLFGMNRSNILSIKH